MGLTETGVAQYNNLNYYLVRNYGGQGDDFEHPLPPLHKSVLPGAAHALCPPATHCCCMFPYERKMETAGHSAFFTLMF